LVRSCALGHIGREAYDDGSVDSEPFYLVPFSPFGLAAAEE